MMRTTDNDGVSRSRSADSRRSWEAIRRFSPSVETRADRQILERLIAAFSTNQQGLDVSAISFFVRNRVVTINGLIRNPTDRQPILALADSVAGVERVIDRLRQAPPRTLSTIFKRSA